MFVEDETRPGSFAGVAHAFSHLSHQVRTDRSNQQQVGLSLRDNHGRTMSYKDDCIILYIPLQGLCSSLSSAALIAKL